MDLEALRPYIDWYKAHFATIFDREGYKWESIQTFQSYSADKTEYYSILKEAFKKSKNLLNSRSVFSLGMVLDIVTYSKEHPEIRPSGLDLFYDLFEGFTGKETHERILDKITFFRQHIREYVRKYMPDKKNDYQDLHAVSVYLSHRYPDKFYIYRTYEFNQFNKLLNNEFSFKWGKDSNYISYLNMCDQLNAILRQELKIDKGFRIIVDKLTKENPNCYDDPEYRLLTQDFIYSVVSYYKTDLIGRYKEQMKSARKSPITGFISVDELIPAKATTLTQGKTPSKIDYVAKQQENTRIGKAGEKWVYEYEKQKLIDASRKDLAQKVVWIAENDDSKGYDIVSYDKDGNEIFIEVKTTSGSLKTPFYMSALELEINRQHVLKYHLYRVYDFNKEPKLRIITGDLSKLNPQPTTYIFYTE